MAADKVSGLCGLCSVLVKPLLCMDQNAGQSCYLRYPTIMFNKGTKTEISASANELNRLLYFFDGECPLSFNISPKHANGTKLCADLLSIGYVCIAGQCFSNFNVLFVRS